MPAPDSGFGSNNPFRRSTPGGPSSAAITAGGSAAPSSSSHDAAAATPSTSTPRPPFTTFKAVTDDRGAEISNQDPVQTKPKKIVKKVRVQSPPPSSPESTTPARNYPPDDYSDSSSSSDDSAQDVDQVDPFSSSHAESDRSLVDDEPPLPRPPPNPFSKTLQDLEQHEHAQDGQPGAGGKGAMDVDSFKRLLLTGYANIPGPGGQGAAGTNLGSQQSAVHDGASNTDASSVSRQSIFDAIQETPRTSHEISEPEEPTIAPTSPLANVQSASGRKKPPPPSSRHGKLIKIELGADGMTQKGPSPAISIDTTSPTLTPNRRSSTHSLSQSSPPSSSDINKPLPLPPVRPAGEEDVDSPFDREAAGKLPESFVPLPTNQPPTPLAGTTRARSESQTSTLTTSSAHRKPAAPPPRRHGHGRSDSKPPSILSDKAEEDPPRSSLESNRSRADSIRVNVSSDKSLSAPAPPPPRRPNHARHGSSYASPTVASFAHVPSPGSSDDSRSPGVVGFNPIDSHQHIGAMATVTHSRDGVPKLSPPPPPPARHSSVRRPSSAHSTEAGSLRRAGREKEGGLSKPPPPPPRARGSQKGSSSAVEAQIIVPPHSATVDPGAGDDIMEQLKALQQEVEAARKASDGG